MVDATLVTIHGFWSGPSTWDRLATRWSADDELVGVGLHPFRYPSPKVRPPLLPTRVPDHDDIAQMFATEFEVRLADAPAIAIVTHSQGGLVLQRFFTWMLHQGRGRELSRVFSVVMLACPNNGSNYLSSLRRMVGLGRNPQAARLDVLDRQVADIQRAVLEGIVNAAEVGERSCPIPMHVYAGGSDDVVKPASAQAAFPGASTLAGDHFSILDPKSAGNLTAETVRFHLLQDLAARRPAGPATNSTTKYRVDVRNSMGTVIGDKPRVTQSFGAPPPPADADEGYDDGRTGS